MGNFFYKLVSPGRAVQVVIIGASLILVSSTLLRILRPAHSASHSAVASIFFSPATKQIRIGDTVELSLLLSISDQSINAVGGRIIVPSEAFDVLDVSTESSVNTIWLPRDPYYSTDEYSVIFYGGLPNPGFMGEGGNIITISLRAKALGRAELTLKDVEVLANDGEGTGIFTATGTARIMITAGVSGDLNYDGNVTFGDISILLANWGVPRKPETDLNQDGAVDLKDLSLLMANYGN